MTFGSWTKCIDATSRTRALPLRLISTQSRSCRYFLSLIFSDRRGWHLITNWLCIIAQSMKSVDGDEEEDEEGKKMFIIFYDHISIHAESKTYRTDTLMRWTEKLNAHLMTNLWIVTFNGLNEWLWTGKTKTTRRRRRVRNHCRSRFRVQQIVY